MIIEHCFYFAWKLFLWSHTLLICIWIKFKDLFMFRSNQWKVTTKLPMIWKCNILWDMLNEIIVESIYKFIKCSINVQRDILIPYTCSNLCKHIKVWSFCGHENFPSRKVSFFFQWLDYDMSSYFVPNRLWNVLRSLLGGVRLICIP